MSAEAAGEAILPRFDRAAFDARLRTRRLGHALLVRASATSTNDLAWDALAEGLPDGVTVIAEAQTEGRGRHGRSWFMAPGKGLALSVALHLDCDRRQLGALPLVAGLALARALDALGLNADLKWPNDLLVGDRKLSGILVETRRLALADGRWAGEAAVIGVGVNVGETDADLPPDLRARATSLAIEGCAADRESVAAGFLGALEPLWDALQEGGRDALLEQWRRRARFWGTAVTVRAPDGERNGIALDLDADGALVLRLADGSTATVLAGDVVPAVGGGPA
jgi:BirA family biotin operon repressor/biotin-[acetyl-CoA-carboxylase] ligase